MAAVGRAAAFSFAGILAFAAVVAGFATAFAFAGVITFTGVNVLLVFLVAHLAERDAGFAGHIGGVRLNGERTAHQSGDRSAGKDCFRFHVFLSVWFITRDRMLPEFIEAGLDKVGVERTSSAGVAIYDDETEK